MSSMRRLCSLLGEGVAIARTQPIATAATALVIAAISAVVLASVGQTAAAEQRLLSQIDEAGTRTIVLSDPAGRADLRADSMSAIGGLDGMAWAIGFGPVVDVRNPDLGLAARPVPGRAAYGDLVAAPIVVEGAQPHDGDALVGADARLLLGLVQPAGAVRYASSESAVVGEFRADEPLGFLNHGVVVLRPATHEETLRQVYVVAESVADVDRLVAALPLVVTGRASELTVDSPAQLLELRSVVSSELATNAWRLLLLVFGVGLLVVAITLFGAISQKRRDFGRRRALGASRSAIVVLVLTQSTVAAALGTVVGLFIGLVVVWLAAGALPGPEFVLGVAALTVLTALVASVPPALIAAYRDPVRILRVP